MTNPIFKNNEKTVTDYKDYLRLQDLKDSTITNKCWNLIPFFQFIEFEDINNVTKKDIERFVISLKRSGKKETYQHKNILELRIFLNWLKPDNDFFSNIKMRQPKKDNSEKTYVAVDDVIKMLPHCSCQRDRAFLFLMWESAARLDELISLNVENVKPDKYGTRVTVTGKTGKRDILVIDTVPDLQLWINQYKGDKTDPLFPTTNGRRLTHRWAQAMLKTLKKRAGIEGKSVHPHSLRHGRLTELSNLGMSEMQMRLFAGWDNKSDMPATYIHTKQKDVYDKLLSIKGIKREEEDIKLEIKTASKICPRCQTANPFDGMYCRTCSMILDPIKAQYVKEEEEDMLFNKFYDKMQNMLDDSFAEVVGEEKPKTTKKKQSVSKK